MKFEPGDIVFIMHNESWLSKAIAKVMGSKWSHSAVVYGEAFGKTLLCETSLYQVNLDYLDRYLDDPNCEIEVYRKNGISEQGPKIRSNCDLMLGKMYGYLQLLSLGIRRVFRLKIPNFIHQGMVCCHVVAYALNDVDREFTRLDKESFDTEELYDMVKVKYLMVLEKRAHGDSKS